MNDQQFRVAFESCSLERSDWDHRAHLRVAWVYLAEVGLGVAVDRMREGIVRFDEATQPDNACNYHETITRFWLEMVARARQEGPADESFEAFCERCPELLNKRLILQYFTQPTIVSDEARERWIEPDRQALPGEAA